MLRVLCGTAAPAVLLGALARKFFLLSSQFLSALPGSDEYVIGVSQLFVPRIPYLAEPGIVGQFNAMEGFQQLVVDFGLQFLRISLKQTREFWAGRFSLPASPGIV